MNSNFQNYLFLKLKLRNLIKTSRIDVSVSWENNSGMFYFKVGESYLPPTLLISPFDGVTIETANNRFRLHENSALFLNNNEKFTISYSNNCISECMYLFLKQDPQYQYQDFIENKIFRNEYILSSHTNYFLSNFDCLRNDILYQDQLYDLFIKRINVIQTDMLKEINKLDFKKWSTKEEIYRRLCKSVEYMNDLYNNNISLNELAKESNISKYHYIRIFKKLYAKTPYEYLSEIRISKAKSLLLNTCLPVTEISDYIGYNNLSHFSLAFKKATGLNPQNFRTRFKKSNIL